MRHLYTVLFYLALPYLVVRSLWRARNYKQQWRRFGERLGFYATPKLTSSIWLHAVSYGEAVASEPLLKKLLTAFPNTAIVITTMTLTGALRVQSSWQTQPRIQHLYVPYDVPGILRRFLKQVNPVIGIIMETELWPNLLHIAGQQQLPLFLANARLSPRSLAGYQQIRRFIAPFLPHLTRVGAQSDHDAKRYISLGVPSNQISVIGNMKFDVVPPEKQVSDGKALRSQLLFDTIIVAASTHAPEEEQLLNVYSKLQKNFSNTMLILIPRHPERFDEVASLCLKKGFEVARRSQKQLPTTSQQIYLGDTMGELYFFYTLADIAFVGGSLLPVGGHNMLEPAALQLPIVTGQYLFNFVAVSELLLKTQSLHIAENQAALYEIFNKLITQKDYRQRVGREGYESLINNQGATARHLALITELMSSRSKATIQ